MVNDSSKPDKLVMSSNSIIDNSFFETFFGMSNVELPSFANSYKKFELLPCNQIVELNCTNSWTLYFDIFRNEYGVDDGCLLIDSCGNQTYLVIQLEHGCTNIVGEYETLVQGLRKAININIKYIEVFGGSQKVIK